MNVLCQRKLAALAAFLYFLSTACTAQPPIPKPPGMPALPEPPPKPYALDGVEVVAGGYPIRGEDGHLFSLGTEDGCLAVLAGTVAQVISAFRPVPPESETSLAGLVGSTIDLEISVAGCEIKTAPEVACGWTIRPRRQMVPRRYWDTSCRCYPGNERGQNALDCAEIRTVSSGFPEKWTGWTGQVKVELPSRSGRYDLTLDCEVEGTKQAPLRWELFAVYAEPLTWVSPPERDWYRRATCWGEGFQATVPESEVLEQMLAGLYRYGQENWNYGYTRKCGGEYYFSTDNHVWKCRNGKMVVTKDSPNAHFFELEREAVAERLIQYHIEGIPELDDCAEGDTCYCSWQSIVATDPICDFSDCYTFSEALTAISSTMGIGGLRMYELRGRFNLGFMTRPDARALDPRFRGNVLCDQSLAECYPYEFGSHSVRHRDGLWYDATFQGIYSNPNDGIGLSVNFIADGTGGNFIADFQDVAIVSLGHRYGTWQHYGIVPSLPSLGDMPQPAKETILIEDVELSGSGEEPHRSLKAEITTETVVPGTYVLTGLLYKGETLVADRVDLHTSTRPSVTLVSGSSQKKTVSIYFSGGEVARSREDGPYDVHILVSSDGETIGKHSFSRGDDLKSSQFAGSDVTILELPEPEKFFGAEEFVAIEETNGVEDKVQALTFRIPVTVTTPGRYAFELRLAETDGRTLAYSGRSEELTADQTEVVLVVDGCEISQAELPATYNVTLQVFNGQLIEISSDAGEVQQDRPEQVECVTP